MKEKKIYTLTWLFFINIFISAFTFGGGYVVIPMIRKYFVQQKHLLSEEEVMDMAAIAQSSPGAIAVNLASLAGYKTAGLVGAILSCVASVLPALILLSIISTWYASFAANAAVAAVLKGMEAGVAALIVSLVIDMYIVILQEKSWLLSLLVPLVFFGNYFLGLNVALLLIVSCLLCVAAIKFKQKGEPSL